MIESEMLDLMERFLNAVKSLFVKWAMPLDSCKRSDELEQASTAFWFDLETEFEKLCHSGGGRAAGSFGLRGTPVRVARPPMLLGTSAPRRAFENRLRSNGIKKPRQFVTWILDESKVPATKKTYFDHERKRITITQFGAFATWSTSADPDPFWFADGDWRGYKIHVELGLSPLRLTKKILLFVYSTPAGCSLLYPTIADGALFTFFGVVSSREYHGLTVPWDKEFIHTRSHQSSFRRHRKHITAPLDKSYLGGPRPELVHSPLPLVHIDKVTEV
jgi:hypothetical protein